MNRASLALLVVVVMIGGSREASAAPRDTEAAVTIRTYNYDGISRVDLLHAREAADRIFRNARIGLHWIDCRIPGLDDGEACTDPINEGREFLLRLLPPSSAPAQGKAQLGESLLDRNRQSGVLITLDPELIRSIAQKAQSDGATLLGRAIAHELGHLLLGLGAHPRSGLMRAFWSTEEIRGLRPADWQFSGRESAQIRQGLLVKARTAN